MLPGSGDTHPAESSVTHVTSVTVVDNYLYLLNIICVTLPLSIILWNVTKPFGVTLQRPKSRPIR